MSKAPARLKSESQGWCIQSVKLMQATRFCCAYLRNTGFSLDVRKLIMLSYWGPQVDKCYNDNFPITIYFMLKFCPSEDLVVTCWLQVDWLLDRCYSGLKEVCVSICHYSYHLNSFKRTRWFWGFHCWAVVLLVCSGAMRF